MSPEDMLSFIAEIGVSPKRIRVGAWVFADFMASFMRANLYRTIERPLFYRIAPPSLQLMGVEVVLSERLEPAAFEFDMEAA